jgi:ligand-binding sensor domain-containing protein
LPAPIAARIAARANFLGSELVATDLGLFRRSRADAAWLPFPLGTTLPCGDRISALAEHRGALWVGSFDRGLCRRDARGWTHLHGPSVLPSDMVNELASDGERLYVATARGLAVLLPDGSFRSYVHTQCIADLKAACPWHAAVNGVALDTQTGSMWIADHAALHNVGAAAGTPWLHLASSIVGSSALTHVAVSDGVVAVGSGDQGVLLRRGRYDDFIRVDDQAGLADNWVMDLTFDAHGSLWVATCTRGVSVRSRGGKLRSLGTEDGLIDDYTLSVNAIDGLIWVGTLSGVSIVDPLGKRPTQSFDVTDGLSGNEVHDAVAFDGKVWLATDAGLSVLESTQSSDDVAAVGRYAR